MLILSGRSLALGVQAQAHMDSGLQHFDVGDYARAAEEFEAGYRIEPDPELLYNWASAEFMAANYQVALELFRRLDLAKLPPEFAVFATKSMAECERKLATEEPKDPEKPKEPPPEEVVPPPPPRRGPWYRDVLGGSLVIGGAASLAIGFGFYVSAEDHYLRALEADTLDRDVFVRELTTANRHQALALVVTAAGTGLIVGGLLRYRNRPYLPAPAVTVSLGAHGGFVGWGWTF